MNMDRLTSEDALRRRWRIRRAVWTGGCLLVLLAGAGVLVAAQGPSARSLVRGVLAGYFALGALVAGAEILAPRQFVRWRRWMMEGGPQSFQLLGDLFDRRIMDKDRETRSERRVLNRIRVVGLIVLASVTLTGVFGWWALSGLGPS
jgi:hypothetical protein